jgi:uncharacterized phiE125 gp8 family phage protein
MSWLGGFGLYGHHHWPGEGHCIVGSINLTESSPPQSFIEPLTLGEVKSYLKVPERSPTDSAEDDEILSLISGAREQAEIMQGRDLVRKRFDLNFDHWPHWRIQLRAHLASVDLFQYRDSGGTIHPMVADTDYIVDTAKSPGEISTPYGATWPSFTPWPSSAILIRFTAGLTPDAAFWNDAGGRIKNGMKLLISAWYNNRLPFEVGRVAALEYPYSVTSCLEYGALRNVR